MHFVRFLLPVECLEQRIVALLQLVTHVKQQAPPQHILPFALLDGCHQLHIMLSARLIRQAPHLVPLQTRQLHVSFGRQDVPR